MASFFSSRDRRLRCDRVLCARSASPPPPAAPRSVTEIRFRTESDRTRIVIDLSGESRYCVTHRRRPVPDRHRSAELPVSPKTCGNIDVRDGLLDRIRVNRLKAAPRWFSIFPGAPSSPISPSNRVRASRIASSSTSRGPSRGASAATAREGGPCAPRFPRRGRKTAPRARGGDRVVIIDPGHGGDAPGTISRSGIQEKTLNLKLAKMLKSEIEKHPGYRAILVRDGDYDVNWVRRVSFARERGGEVFVSLHFNSNESQKMRGLEVYFLSLEASDENAAAVAERENLLVEAGADSAGFNDDLKSILFDVSLASAIQGSSALAEEVASVIPRGSADPVQEGQAGVVDRPARHRDALDPRRGRLPVEPKGSGGHLEGELSALAREISRGRDRRRFSKNTPQAESAAGN